MRRPSTPLGVWVAVVLALSAAGCGTSPYYATQERYTREVDSYEDLVAKALVAATLKTEPFRRAYVDEYARLFVLSPEQKVGLLEAELEEDRNTIVVMVAFYTEQAAWNDLNPARGIWEVRIENVRGDIAQPFQVNRMNKRNPTWGTLYPYLRKHHVLYELRFERNLPDGRPIARPGETLDLVIAGAPTRVRLRWVVP